MLPKIIT